MTRLAISTDTDTTCNLHPFLFLHQLHAMNGIRNFILRAHNARRGSSNELKGLANVEKSEEELDQLLFRMLTSIIFVRTDAGNKLPSVMAVVFGAQCYGSNGRIVPANALTSFLATYQWWFKNIELLTIPCIYLSPTLQAAATLEEIVRTLAGQDLQESELDELGFPTSAPRHNILYVPWNSKPSIARHPRKDGKFSFDV